MCRKHKKASPAPSNPELRKAAELWQRRRFLKQVAISLGGVGALARNTSILALLQAMAPEYGIKKAFAANPGRRRHLINLIGWGGWDSSWWHNAVAVAPFEQAQAGGNTGIFVSSDRVKGFEPTMASRGTKITKHFGDDQRMNFGSSFQGRPHVIGKAMRALFGNLSATASLNDLVIWKGLTQQGQHDIGNFALNQGMSSSYAKSFAAVVSAHLASEDYPRRLHYVSLSNTPEELFTNFALAKGFEAPICVPDAATFSVLTRPASTVFTATEEGRLATAVGRLAREAMIPNLTLPSSRDLASNFLISYDGANSVANSKWGDSTALRAAQVRYMQAILTALNDIAVVEQAAVGNPLNFVGGATYAAYISAALAGINAFYTADYQAQVNELRLRTENAWVPKVGGPAPVDLVTLDAQVKAILDANQPAITKAAGIQFSGKDGAALSSQVVSVGSMAFYFGMADFLVRMDISAVVDLPIGIGDEHYRWTRGLPTSVATFAAYRELIVSLKEQPQKNGQNLFDQTTLVMHTELDRFPFLEPPPNGPGTNHANTASVILAGYGVNRGRVVGDISLGPLENPAFRTADSATAPVIPFWDALPVDPKTGIAEPNQKEWGKGGTGEFLSVKALFPTVCGIFGAPVPAQQVTEYSAVDAVIKKS